MDEIALSILFQYQSIHVSNKTLQIIYKHLQQM